MRNGDFEVWSSGRYFGFIFGFWRLLEACPAAQRLCSDAGWDERRGGLPLACRPVCMLLLFISDAQHIMPEQKVTFPFQRAPVTPRHSLIWAFSDVIVFP